MKVLCLLLAVAFTHTATAQDYCKKVRKEVSTNNLQFDFMSPYTPSTSLDEMSPLYVKRNISKDEDYPFDNFFVIFQVKCPVGDIYEKTFDDGQTERKETKLYIEFTDNSKIIDDTVEVNHDFTEDRAEAIRYIFYPVTEANASDFTTKKIAKFTIGGQERLVPIDSGTAVMEYVKCIKAGGK